MTKKEKYTLTVCVVALTGAAMMWLGYFKIDNEALAIAGALIGGVGAGTLYGAAFIVDKVAAAFAEEGSNEKTNDELLERIL